MCCVVRYIKTGWLFGCYVFCWQRQSVPLLSLQMDKRAILLASAYDISVITIYCNATPPLWVSLWPRLAPQGQGFTASHRRSGHATILHCCAGNSTLVLRVLKHSRHHHMEMRCLNVQESRRTSDEGASQVYQQDWLAVTIGPPSDLDGVLPMLAVFLYCKRSVSISPSGSMRRPMIASSTDRRILS